MSNSVSKKMQFLEAMAGYVLDNGLSSASLRPLAKAAGTSDRMLIYHFSSKNELISELLEYLASAFMIKLENALPPGNADSVFQCAEEIVVLMRNPAFSGFMRVWFDILSSSVEGELAHKDAAKKILGGFHQWMASRLPDETLEPEVTASAILTLVEGVTVMDAAGQNAHADVAIQHLLKKD